jgi:hypothetical protein
MNAASRLRVLVTGMIAADSQQGGATWAVLQYVLGLKQLGHDVYFVEPIARGKMSSVGAKPGRDDRLDQSDAAARFRRIVDDFGLSGSATLLLEGTTETVGLDYRALRRVASRADVLINTSGLLTDPALLEPIGRRVFLDLDPGFNQAWHCDGVDMHFDAHTHFVTVGLAMDRPHCRVPRCEKTWITTLPPVVLRAWPMATRTTLDAFTTVANWRSYGSLHHDGMFLGQKAHALRSLIDLPQRTRRPIALALAIHPGEPDVAALHEHRWKLIDPRRATGTPARYRRFIGGSRAEFGIAKSGYVATRSGWFSDRSACYLACGRPVLAHDTGFDVALPTGEGLLAFSNASDVVAGMDAIDADYARHRRTARAIAETYLDSDRVLARLLDRVGATS